MVHMLSGKDEVRSGDVLAAILQQPKAYAAQLLEAQGITRLETGRQDLPQRCSRLSSPKPTLKVDLSRRGGPHPLDRCSSQLRWNPGS